MSLTVEVSMDHAGRIVVPKALRDRLGVEPGQPLRARVNDGRLEIEPEPIRAELVDEGGVLVITPTEPLTPLSREDVRALIEDLRR
ncbi:MAG: AbrB/MazE/SpoVT family DNA-binding domain-containing protein [Ilumatobacteraceae bacterium]